MHPLLQTMLGKFDLKKEVSLTIEKNGRRSYLKGLIVDIQETYLLVSTNTSILRISPDSIVRIGQPKYEEKAKNVSPSASFESKKKSETKINKEPVPIKGPKDVTPKKDSNVDRPKDWNPKMLIPKMGEIIGLSGDELTIQTNRNEHIKVSRSIIIDKKLNTSITDYVVNKREKLEIPVIWGELGGEILCLLGISTLESINSRVNTSRDVGNTKMAYALALLLNAHSTFPVYVRQLESFQQNEDLVGKGEKRLDQTDKNQTSEIQYSRQGILAKEAGDFERAIKLFRLSIENNEIGKSIAFRELVNTQIILGRFEEAYSLLSEPGIMDFTSPLLHGSSQKNFNWLSTCLTRTGHEEDVIKINLIHAEENITSKQKAGCYNRIAAAILRTYVDGQEEKAEEYFRKALEVDPDNKAAKEGLSALRPDNFDLGSVEEIIDLEPSSYADDKLPVIPEDKRSKQYKDSLIDQLRILRSNSYSERANLHLQLASVEKTLGQESDMHRDMARYLMNSVLEGRRSKNLHSDAAIFMLCESIVHWSISANKFHGRERRLTHYQDCLALFITLFNRQNPYYFFNSPKLYSAFENRLYEIPEFYPSLPAFLQYRVPFVILMKDLWETSAQSSAVNYLNENNFSFSVEEGKDKFDQGFKMIANRERTYLSDLVNRLRRMARSAGYEEMKGRLDEIGQPNLNSELDAKRFIRFKNFIDNTLTRYFHNEDITNKYYTQEDSLRDIDALLNEIIDEPTRFSYDGLRPVLLSVRDLVQSDYKRLSENSKPKIEINQSGDCTLHGDELSFQLNIANGKGCLAVNNYHVEIAVSNDVLEHVEGMKTVYDSLSGGSDKNLVQRIRIAQTAVCSEIVTINVTFYHGTVGKSEEQSTVKRDISLHLRNDDIPSNPYKLYAGGKPIEHKGRKMFFGRKDDIKSVANAMMAEEGGKQIIVYGQSRSGKTSFINMLAIELEDRGAWCAKFSLQGAYPTSLASFFAVIMDKIVNLLYEEHDWRETDFKYAVGNHSTLISDTYQNTPESSIATLYINDLCALQRAVRQKWGKKLILMIDEFTELYTWIKKGLLPDSIMKIWKAVSEDGRLDYSVVLIGQDTTPLFMREPYASNPFQVVEPRRMSYLPMQDARDMVVMPILDREGKSRFVGKAVDRIIEYTAGSPYYLMIFCNQLVTYMQERQIGKVTDVDIDEVAKICIMEQLNDKFDNLYAAVEPPMEEKERSKAILKAIAFAMEQHKDGASRAEIYSKLNTRYNEEEIDQVLTDLNAREVVQVKQNIVDEKQDKFTIKVIIFQKWLLEN